MGGLRNTTDFKNPEIAVDNELAGFVLIHKIGTTKDIDWTLGEFFVVAKFQGKGVGREVTRKIFT